MSNFNWPGIDGRINPKRRFLSLISIHKIRRLSVSKITLPSIYWFVSFGLFYKKWLNLLVEYVVTYLVDLLLPWQILTCISYIPHETSLRPTTDASTVI